MRWLVAVFSLGLLGCGAHRGYTTSNPWEAAVVTAGVIAETAACDGRCAWGARRHIDTRRQSPQIIPETLLGEERFDDEDHSVLPSNRTGGSPLLPARALEDDPWAND